MASGLRTKLVQLPGILWSGIGNDRFVVFIHELSHPSRDPQVVQQFAAFLGGEFVKPAGGEDSSRFAIRMKCGGLVARSIPTWS
jgi:hypothetical protein